MGVGFYQLKLRYDMYIGVQWQREVMLQLISCEDPLTVPPNDEASESVMTSTSYIRDEITHCWGKIYTAT